MLLALPEVVARLHTSVSHVVWVIVVYNLALIATALAIRLAPARVAVEPLLVAGLLLFGAASLAAGLASNLTGLLVARGFQGAGGAILLCASLPPIARASGDGTSPLRTWSAAAAVGAAIGPAASDAAPNSSNPATSIGSTARLVCENRIKSDPAISARL